jgi:hypothetical protein
VDTYLLARVAYLLAAGNWQRGGGKGPRPKPVKPPGAPRDGRRRRDRGADAARRLGNLGLLPGHQPLPGPVTARERALAAAIEAAQQRNKPDLS